MLRPVLLIALLAVAAASGPKSAYHGYNVRSALSGIGLPSFYKPRDSLSGLLGYLQQTGVSEAQFIARVQKYGPAISRTVHLMRKQYRGVSADLLQLAVLRYYGSEPHISYKLPLAKYFGRYIRKTKIPSPSRYNAKYVNIFLGGFKGYLRKHVKPQRIVVPVPLPMPTYAGYELLAILKSIGLPKLSSPKSSLGGIVAYLKAAKISQATFIRGIQIYSSAIRKVVVKHQKQYKGFQLDLLQVAALRYYGISKPSGYKVSFSYALKQALQARIYTKYSVSYVRIFLIRFSRILVTLPYPGYDLIPALKRIGLPKLYSAKYSLGGLVAYLKVAKISQTKFVSRITKYGGKIRQIVLKYQKQYKGFQLDLLQVAALRYYGISKPSGYKVSFSYALKQALQARIYTKYSVSYVRIFLIRFSRILVTLPYPGYDLIPALKRIGLPKLYSAKNSLGGLVAYLKVTKISQTKFVSRITKYGGKIRQIVLKYQKQYKGFQLDLLQVAALRYYGISKPSGYKVSFSYALKQALQISVYKKYSVSFVSSFLIRFSKYLVTPVYPGYQLKALLKRIGLPKLTSPKHSLSGLVAYLQSNKLSLAALISRIQKYGPNIKATVYRYKKQYSGTRADLLQLCAIRYYAFPLVIRRNVRFGHAFHKYLSSQSLKLYNASVVNKFLSGFIKYIRKYQLKKYTGVFW